MHGGTGGLVTPELSDARFMRSLLAASDDCIKVIALDGTLSFMSEGGQRTMEVSDFNALKGCPWPDFWQGQGNADALHALDEARAGRSARFQGAANTAAGNPRYWDVQVSPILDAQGRVENILSVSRDISAMKAAEEQQRLLALELKHRMKNTIAMIQAIANQTLRGGDETEKVKALFLGRLGTLSAAQDVLTQSVWARASLSFLIGETLKAHCSAAQFSVDGPEVELSSKMALAMALALHELATNATKYGALSRDDGRIAIGWSMTADEFHFRWQEIGGPPVALPTHRGFGSRMIEKALASSVQGISKIAYEPAGIVFTLTAPIEALTTD